MEEQRKKNIEKFEELMEKLDALLAGRMGSVPLILKKQNIAPGYSSTSICLDAWTSMVYLETPTHTALHVEIVIELDRWASPEATEEHIRETEDWLKKRGIDAEAE